MKNIFSIFNKQEIRDKIIYIFLRFPFAAMISIVVTILFFSIVPGNMDTLTQEIVGRSIVSGIVVFFLSIGVSLFVESMRRERYFSILGQIGVIIFGLLFFYFLSADISSFENIVFFILSLHGIIAFLFCAPYIKYLKKDLYKPDSYYIYFYDISTIFLITSIVALTLTILGNIAILTVYSLFDLSSSFSGDIYAYWTIISLVFFAPLFALSQFPDHKNFEKQSFHENVFFSFLVRYIASIFIYIYFFILYTYTFKVLLNFSDWPKGAVSWMVIGFSTFGYIIYIFSYIFENKKNKHIFIIIFRRYFPYVVLPQLAMLFYAIFLRIGQYDFTINRYFVVVFGIWLSITSLYLIISSKKSLLYIPSILVIITLIISIGPWSVYNFPLSRQLKRLENNLIQANILQNGKIIPLKTYEDIPSILSGEIYNGIEYICDFDSCSKIKELFPSLYIKAELEDKENFKKNTGDYQWKEKINGDTDKYTGITKWNLITSISKNIKVKDIQIGYNDTYLPIYDIYNNSNVFPLDVSKYSLLLEINSYNNPKSSIFAIIDMENEELSIQQEASRSKINISYIIENLRKKYQESTPGGIQKEEMIFDISSEEYDGQLIIQNARIPSDKDNIGDIDSMNLYINAFLLLNEK